MAHDRGGNNNRGPRGETHDELQVIQHDVAAMRRVVIAEGCDVAEITGVVGSVRVIEADGRGAEVEACCRVGAVPEIQPQRRGALEEGFESGGHATMDGRGVRCEHVLALLADGVRREREL